jgi:arginyl-tRNA synthetase
MDAMIATARETSQELGKLDDMPADEQQRLFRMVALAALKYFILKVDPQKTMLFNPKESIDFNGNTGPFIQYTYARIRSVLRKASNAPSLAGIDAELLGVREQELIKTMSTFPQVVQQAGAEHSPALVANFAYELAKEFNQYYHDVTILREENIALRTLKLALAEQVARALKTATGLLGIEVPERM